MYSLLKLPGNRDTLVLAACQALFTAAISIDLTLTGLTGFQLAPNKALATLPFALITISGAVMTVFASLLMKKTGRRTGFILGSLMCAAGGLVSAWSIIHHNFPAFCAGTASVGIFQAFAQYYRLAAADATGSAGKAKAIALVLTGSVIAAVTGPVLAIWGKGLLPVQFAGSYLVVALLGLLSAIVLSVFYRDACQNNIPVVQYRARSRSLGRIAAQPVFIAAIANTVTGGAVMMFLMTATPLAAVAEKHSINDGANIIQWHLVGMYAPSLFAGWLIQRTGVYTILFSGMLLTMGCAVVALASTSLPAFYIALLFLGIGWNFMFVGGTTLLARSYRQSERAKVQGFAELIRYGFTAVATLIAGPLLQYYGWGNLNAVILPFILLNALITWLCSRHHKRPVTRAAKKAKSTTYASSL
jgi:MFS family permease